MSKTINLIYSIFIILFSIILFAYPTEIFQACKYGLLFWYKNILPSLFPFMVLSSLLLESNLVLLISKMLSPFSKFLWNVSGEGMIAFVLGCFCGFPLGAKVTADLKNKNIISSNEASRLIGFCNNCSPMFIITVVSLNLLGDLRYAPYIITVQLVSAVSVGIIFRFFYKTNGSYKKTSESLKKDDSPKAFSKILNDSITNAAYVSITLCSFIVFYTVFIHFLELSHLNQYLKLIFLPLEKALCIDPLLQGKLTYGLFDISNGVNVVANSLGSIFHKLLLINIIINWGSFSVHSQVFSVIHSANISIKPYLLGKLLQSAFSIVYSFLFFIL